MNAPPIVIKLGGLAVEDPRREHTLLDAIVSVHASGPGGVVLVHGGGRAVDEHLARLGLSSERREGLRVTTPEQIGEIVAVLAGRLNKAIVAAIQSRGALSVGLCLGDGGTVRARRLRPDGADIGLVGEADGGDARLLHGLLAARFLPVISPIAFDADGGPLNINADDAAAAVAAIIGARLLLLLTDVPCLLDQHGTPIAEVDGAEIERLIAARVINGGMIPKARAAVGAAAAAGVPTVIASWTRPSDVAKAARGEPVGTRVTARGARSTVNPSARPGVEAGS